MSWYSRYVIPIPQLASSDVGTMYHSLLLFYITISAVLNSGSPLSLYPVSPASLPAAL